MSTNFDHDYYNTVATEEKKETQEIAQRKNEILRMTDPKRKQTEWNKLFPKLPATNEVY